MIHICNIHCRTLDEDKIESLNIKDKGKWLPFSFLLDIVVAFDRQLPSLLSDYHYIY